MIRSRLVWACLAALSLGLAGCAVPPEPKEFNERIVAWNKELESASKGFDKALRDPVALEGAFRVMESALAKVRGEYESSTYPYGSDGGATLYDAYGSFLNSQDRVLNHYRDILNIARSNPNDPRINDLKASIRSEESKWLLSLQNAQKVFAKEHNFDLGSNY